MKHNKIFNILIMIYIFFGLLIIPVIDMFIINYTGNYILALSLFIPIFILGIYLLVYAIMLK